MSLEELKPTLMISKAVRILLLIYAAANLLSVLTYLIWINWFPYEGWAGEDTSPSGMLLVGWWYGIGLVGIASYVGAVVTFLVWFSRSYRNLIFLRVQQLRASSAWAVWSWFIPIASLWVPLRSMNEIGNASEAALSDDITVFSNTSTPLMHGLWWGFWLSGNILTQIAPQFGASAEVSGSTDLRNIGVILSLTTIAFYIAAGLLLYEIVGEITEKQEKIAKQVTETGPPEPPDFGNAPNFLVQ